MVTILIGMLPEELSPLLLLRADLCIELDGTVVYDKCEQELHDLTLRIKTLDGEKRELRLARSRGGGNARGGGRGAAHSGGVSTSGA